VGGGGIRPHISPFRGGPEPLSYTMLLGTTRVSHLILSSGFSRVHECDRRHNITQTLLIIVSLWRPNAPEQSQSFIALSHFSVTAARLILQQSGTPSVQYLMDRLHWLPIHARNDFKIATLTYKTLVFWPSGVPL